jgi:L-ribulose-5-phosphate 4-epimerase
MLDDLKSIVCEANRDLVRHHLVTLTWGNVSGLDRATGHMVIKPSGVPYDRLQPTDMVVLDLDGRQVEGKLKPSTDARTHLLLYRAFSGLGGVAHAHSRYATMFAQARRGIPCFGTTHADHFHGPVPVTRLLAESEMADYEHNTGQVIVERFTGLDPLSMPAVLVAGHGPFTWGTDATDAVRNAVALEAVAEMAVGTRLINPGAQDLKRYILDKHHRRKHGPSAYYGQK